MNYKHKFAMVVVVFVSLLGTGCENRTVGAITATRTENNPQVVIEHVVTHEGVKVYRFWDGYRYIYYTDARGVTQWHEVIQQGKTSHIENHSVENVK